MQLDLDPPPPSASGRTDAAPASLFAVFDGHGGSEVAKFAARHMVRGCCLVESYQDLLGSKYHNCCGSIAASCGHDQHVCTTSQSPLLGNASELYQTWKRVVRQPAG